MSVYQDIRYRDRLKHEGHELINDIEQMGTHRSVCYDRMAKKLELPEAQVHFTHQTSIEQLERMVLVLREYRAKIAERRRKKPWRGKHPLPTKPPPVVRYIKPRKKLSPEFVKQVKKQKRKDEVLPREEYLKAMAELRRTKTTPQPTVWTRIRSWVGVLL